ncbi:MAG: sigma-70 family RNA polymerase sigma factor [Desulfobacterales bacterium]|nr:MAG: sigma-70 family RNA polymerase sigma factor [Desulfobacterales bacterium]
MSEETLNLAEIYRRESGAFSKNSGHSYQGLRDEELVIRAQNDDPWAIEQLIRRYQRKVYAIAYQMCFADNEEAKDRVQEAFLQAFRSIKKFKAKSSFYTWLYRIVVNTCIDARRRRKRRSRIFSPWRFAKREEKQSNSFLEDYPDHNENMNPLSALSHRQLERDVKNALKLLSEKQRAVFQLKVLQEMSIPEIAEIMDLAEGTVKTHLFRATQMVRNRLRQWIEN